MGERINADLFETIVGNLSQGMYVIQDDEAVFLNRHFGEMFGYESVTDLFGHNMFNEVYPDKNSVDLFKKMHDEMLTNKSPLVSWAQPSARCDGTEFWLQAEARLIEINGRPAILGTFEDQTDCAFMAEAMAVSQQTLRRLLDAMEDRVYVVTDEFEVLYANRKMIETSNADPKVDPCHKVCRGLPEPCEACTIDEVFKTGKPIHKEFFNDSQQAWYSAIELPIRMPGNDKPAKLAVARDITEMKETEQRIRALSHRLITAQEDERAVLSRELHDDLGQRLNAAKISVETIAEDLKDIPPELRDQIDHLADILQGSIDSVRRLSAGLRPSFLERLGLVETLRDHCSKIGSLHNIEIDFKSAGIKELKLDKDTEINLYRIAQEALHNIVKHAGATQASVRLIASHPVLRLRIADNGKGFDTKPHVNNRNQNTNLGLLGIAERVDLLKGNFELKSQPGDGTRLLIEVPCEQL
ncbi:PAS domain S-box-containing protein [Malonomonas rubra DSM 5091]|uniref:Oxygen sensor histidine kinase NreB n=1 Tax=Malonomonas rubra DSM 5091 TaxID=1122189 RepID=A0A1M6DTK4_MALRU|nr:PAS domain S-box protein [Malonomonas rubra]SHI76576.1 PAS domain S-box-containing protein [Malonomonas rubra DSM 5091]